MSDHTSIEVFIFLIYIAGFIILIGMTIIQIIRLSYINSSIKKFITQITLRGKGNQ